MDDLLSGALATDEIHPPGMGYQPVSGTYTGQNGSNRRELRVDLDERSQRQYQPLSIVSGDFFQDVGGGEWDYRHSFVVEHPHIRWDAEQVAIVKAANDGALDDIVVPDCRRFEDEYLTWLRTNRAELLKQLTEKGEFDDELNKAFETAVVEFKKAFVPSETPESADELVDELAEETAEDAQEGDEAAAKETAEDVEEEAVETAATDPGK